MSRKGAVLFSADSFRIRYYNLEVRDRYFSRLKSAIEFNLNVNEKKTVLVSHSMGSTVLLVSRSVFLSRLGRYDRSPLFYIDAPSGSSSKTLHFSSRR